MENNHESCNCNKHNHKHHESCSHHEHNHKHQQRCSHHNHNHGHHECCSHNDHNPGHHECGCSCHEHHEKSKSDAVRYFVSLILFILSFVFKDIYACTTLKILSVILCGYKILFYGVKSIVQIKFDENTLMAAASIASSIMGDFNEAYLIVLLFSIGEYLEEYAVEKSHRRIEGLISLTDDTVFDRKGNKIAAESVKIGDLLLLRPGDKLCVDGVITEGSTSFDTSNLTGESLPRDLITGDEILAGYVNTGKAIVYKATSDYSNSTTAKIKEYVEKARNHKADTEKFITSFAKIYTPAVIYIAFAIGIVFPLAGITTVIESIKRALTFMIASCPCALVISIPLSYYAAIGNASRHGILIKGSKHINTLAKADGIAFDKTGTLTEGKLKVSKITLTGSHTEEEILNFANALEINSSHPIAKAICNAATVKTYSAVDVKEHFGKGIEGVVDGRKVTIGNESLSQSCQRETKSGLTLYIDGVSEAVIELSDSVKSDAAETISLLKKYGIKEAYVLSGDSTKEVEKLGSFLKNVRCFGELLPNEKANKLNEIKSNHNGVIYVGDGVNDAPCLTAADFSVSVGSGSSLALETGDATLISRSLKPLVSVFRIAKHTLRVIYTNISFSLLVKAAVLALAALGIAPIWLALFADVGVLILAVLNSLSILYRKF